MTEEERFDWHEGWDRYEKSRRRTVSIETRDAEITALTARVKVLEAALCKANERIEVIHDEWAEPSTSAAMGQIAAICLIASTEIDAALAPPEPPAEPFVRRNCIPQKEADRG